MFDRVLNMQLITGHDKQIRQILSCAKGSGKNMDVILGQSVAGVHKSYGREDLKRKKKCENRSDLF